ncbi:MAG: gas vesicle protein GvpG [Devosia sp.]
MLGSLVFAPFHGLAFIFREIAKAVDKDREAQREQVMASLRELHRGIETGSLTEAEFQRQEKTMLDRLESLQGNVIE